MAGERRCAYCRQQPVESRWRPFCSERCKMADLGRWLHGDYRIAGTPTTNELDSELDDADRDDDEKV